MHNPWRSVIASLSGIAAAIWGHPLGGSGQIATICVAGAIVVIDTLAEVVSGKASTSLLSKIGPELSKLGTSLSQSHPPTP